MVLVLAACNCSLHAESYPLASLTAVSCCHCYGYSLPCVSWGGCYCQSSLPQTPVSRSTPNQSVACCYNLFLHSLLLDAACGYGYSCPSPYSLPCVSWGGGYCPDGDSLKYKEAVTLNRRFVLLPPSWRCQLGRGPMMMLVVFRCVLIEGLMPSWFLRVLCCCYCDDEMAADMHSKHASLSGLSQLTSREKSVCAHLRKNYPGKRKVTGQSASGISCV